MERRGIYVDKQLLSNAEAMARIAMQENEQKFKDWAASQIGHTAHDINAFSGPQIQTLLFGGPPPAPSLGLGAGPPMCPVMY